MAGAQGSLLKMGVGGELLEGGYMKDSAWFVRVMKNSSSRIPRSQIFFKGSSSSLTELGKCFGIALRCVSSLGRLHGGNCPR